ncbi:MAG: 50S ribosomal protein L9 [Candidatus Babeliales bacterium]
MKVYLRKDVQKIGFEGEIVKVSDGFAQNYLFPRKLAIQITQDNEEFYKKRQRNIDNRKEAIATETSMLAEKIKAIQLILKRKMHNKEKLYGSIAPAEIVDLLAEKGIKVAKNQIIFDKAIKEKGTYDVIIKLSTRLQPKLVLKVLPE